MPKKPYTVSFYHRAYFNVSVEADSEEEAIKLAEKEWEAADFGPVLEYADGGIYSITDEKSGDTTYLK